MHQKNEGLRQSQRARSLHPTDPRRRKTRDALVRAITDAVEQSPNDLTVSEITRRAGVSRSAFYANFSSLTDLAESLMIEAMEHANNVMERMRVEASVDETLRATFTAMREHFVEQRDLYRAILTLPGSASVFRNAVATLIEINLEYMELLPAVPTTVDRNTVAVSIAWSHYGVYDAWLRGEHDIDAELFVDTLFHLLPEWFRVG